MKSRGLVEHDQLVDERLALALGRSNRFEQGGRLVVVELEPDQFVLARSTVCRLR